MFGFLDELVKDVNEHIPSEEEQIYYLFWNKGIDINRFNELPLPYIMSILKTHMYNREQEEKELNKK